MAKTKQRKTTIEKGKANNNYFVEKTLECGVSLRGNEVKSIRAGKASIKGAWIAIEKGQLLLKKMHITKWDTSNLFDVDENRERSLLAHKSEIRNLERKAQVQGYTLIPLKVYFSDTNKVKVLVGLCKGKHDYDKRQVEKEKQAKREMAKALKY